MPGNRSWDDRWKNYPASVPRKAEGGIATAKQRGAMAASWWSGRLVSLLNSYGLGTRMQRGRRYARQGQLVSFAVEAGLLVAQVQGSRATPYVVTVAAPQLAEEQWSRVIEAIRANVGFVAQLLSGEMPPALEDTFKATGVALLPAHWADIAATCSCPDWENPCKHIAAVLYVFADRLDDDPWLLLQWRGRSRDAVLGYLRGATGSDRAAVAPWWPLTPGAALPAEETRQIWPSGDPGHALARLGPLAVDVRGQPVTEKLADAYQALLQGAATR